MFISLDGTAVVQLINFAIFFAILNVVFMRPVGAAIRKRRAYTDGVQGDFERHRDEAQALRADAEQKRVAARRAAEEAVAKTRAQAEAEAEALLAESGSRAAGIIEESRRTVESEFSAAKAREDELSRELARSLLSRATGTPS